MKKIDIGRNSKVNIKWKVLPSDYSQEAENNIIVKFANKYGLSRENVKVEPDFINESGGDEDAFATEAAQNIQDPKFHQKLYAKYIRDKKIEDVDFDEIVRIDEIMNANIDYELYDKHKRYTIKWVKWSNFMSYGPDNFIDLTKLKGLVLLSSEPANQGGKTTFCLDLFRFLLFGKVTSREDDWTLSRVFNDHIPSATEVSVEGCVSIDGVDYVIKRTVTRPSESRRTDKSKVTNKISYYRLANGEYVDLDDEDAENENGSSGRETNKAIKDAIGNERDFDLMIVVDSANLKKLISLKDTERGRLIARWIGLLPLEEKDKLARDYFNKSVSPKLLMNKYNKEELAADNDELTKNNDELIKDGIKWAKEKEVSEVRIKDYKKRRDECFQAMPSIDEGLTETDKNTVEARRESLTNEGLRKKKEKEANEEAYEEVRDVEFDEESYKKAVSTDKKLSIDANQLKNDNERLKREIKQLEEGEFCPTCGARLKDVDNSEKISARKQEIEDNEKELAEIRKKLDKLTKKIEGMESDREKYNKKIKLELIIEKNEVDIENLRSKLRECNRLLKDLDKNDEAIRKCNEITASINLIDTSLKGEEAIWHELDRKIESARAEINSNRKIISDNKKIIAAIEDEEKLVRNWKVYLEMVGKNGVSKMVLRNTLPLINGELKRLLSDVCDFDVEIGIDNHNDVAFYQIHDGVRRKLGAASGFEQTVASLALRSVLSRISTFSKPSFVVFDEILGGIADENYDQVKLLYGKILKDYSCIMQICHLKAIADWHTSQVMIKKENNISRIEVMK